MPGVMRKLLVLLVLLCGAAALAEGELTAAREAAAEARAESRLPSPDQPLWRTAIRLAQEARDAAPESAEAARLLAEIYSEVAWHSRAYGAWLDWAELSGEAPEAEPFAEAALQLGFARLGAGDPEGADRYYSELLEFQPEHPEGLYRAGVARMQSGDGSAAQEPFRRLLELSAPEGLSDSQLELARHVTEHGAAAGREFSRGLTAWDAEDFPEALDRFSAAWDSARTFTQAAVWAGRTALELGDYGQAVRWWKIAVDLDPDDERSRWFLAHAEQLDDWGEEAVARFAEGQTLYETDGAAEAYPEFRAAARAAPRWTEALRWAGRTAQESGDWSAAVDWWQRVLDLEPDDETAAYFLRSARQRTAFGEDAGAGFLEALDAFQRADFSEAENGFLAVTEADPDHAAAWGYLGQIRFAQGRYAEAEEAYRKAADLEPDNDEYEFFARESARLAGARD